MDVALDPFPFSGSLTTCDALWMGVPVVTCPTETFAGRHSLTHLANLGLTELVAADFSDYVRRAVDLARDLPRLAALRRPAAAHGGLAVVRRPEVCREPDGALADRMARVGPKTRGATKDRRIKDCRISRYPAHSVWPAKNSAPNEGKQVRTMGPFSSRYLDRPNREAVKSHSPGQAQRRPGLAVGEEL